jgi:hypothetical protein
MLLGVSSKIICEASDDELIAELKDRADKRAEPPKPISPPSCCGCPRWVNVREQVVDYIKNSRTMARDLRREIQASLFDSALQAVYGPDIFEWIMKQEWYNKC